MAVEIVSGKIQTLGASTTTNGAITTYSYIEMSDGQIIKELSITTGLNGELRSAFNAGEAIELYVHTLTGLDSSYGKVIFMVRHENGRAFSSKIPSSVGNCFYLFLAVLGVLIGIALTLEDKSQHVFGWGATWIIFSIFVAYMNFTGLSRKQECNKHLKALNPICLNS